MEKLGKKLKHDHTLTSILKFAIFSLVMLAPVFSVASRCLYVICNKNAKDSYSDEMVEQQISLSSTSQLIENQTYIMNFKEYTTTEYNYIPYITYNSINVDWSNYTTADTTNVIAFRVRTNDNFMQLKKSDNTTINLYNVWGQTLKTITFNFKSAEFNSTAQLYNLTLTGIYYKQTTLDNAFEYSLSQLQESSYYNWATNLGIYTPIYNMVHGLGAHDIVALLVSYWAIYTCIYVVFDIIIVCFVKITHFMQSE